MSLSFSEKKLSEIKLIGFAIKHTLEEDKELNVVEKMFKEIKDNSQDDALFLVQLYDEEYDDSGKIITFIGSESSQNKNFSTLIIPENTYLMTKATDDTIDEAYEKSYAYLEKNQIAIESNYDFEINYLLEKKIEVLFPLLSNMIAIPSYLEITDFLN